MSNSYYLGSQVEITAAFTEDGAAVDPTNVYFQAKAPSRTITSWQYGVDVEVTNPAVGTYVLQYIDANEAGVWHYRVYSTAAHVAAAEGRFDVKESEFD